MFNFLMYIKKRCLVEGLKIDKERDVMILDLGENGTELQICFLGELVKQVVRDRKISVCVQKRKGNSFNKHNT